MKHPDRAGDGRAPKPGNLASRVGFWAGLVAFFGIQFFVDLDPARPAVTAMAAVAALMATWWMTEAIPIPATALIPVALFPLLGILSGTDTAARYIDRNIMLFLGGFLIALAMQRWNLHKRIALIIVGIIGGQPVRLVLGFMIASAFLSMWISNTATTMMMLPMGLAIVLLYEEMNENRRAAGEPVSPRAGNFTLVLLLGIAYAGSIGGFATKIGTPPNVVFASVFETTFPGAPEISFVKWMAFAFPLSFAYLWIAWFLLCWVIFPLPKDSPFSGKAFVRDELRRLGRPNRDELMVLVVFVSAAFLWLARRDVVLGENWVIPGWAPWLAARGIIPDASLIDDGTIAIMMGLLLFLLPARGGGRIMNWETTRDLPWGTLLLFGGGFALAEGFRATGLSNWIGDRFVGLSEAPPWLTIVAISGTINFVTELTSNTATTTVILPILASLAQTIRINPLIIMVPATLSASFAFMLPVATPPNAIVYGSGRIPIAKMIKAGFILNILGVLLVSALTLTLGLTLFDISLNEFPAWAEPGFVPPIP